MAERPGIDFERTVEIPANPFDAARVYLAVLAYPERDAGQPRGLGVPFAEALWQYVVWDRRRAKGLRDVRRLFGDPTFMPPRRRDFEGALNRGRNRVQRRVAAFDIVGNRMINGFLNAGLEAGRHAAAGRSAEAFERAPGSTYAPIKQDVWDRNTLTARRIVHCDLDRWSDPFGSRVEAEPVEIGRYRLQHPGADTALHVFSRLALQDHAFNSFGAQQVAKQQSGGSSANDRNLRLHMATVRPIWSSSCWRTR